MKYDLKECLQKQKQILEDQGYTVAYICIYGSQNYGLDLYTDEYQSDVDMKAIIVPTLDDLIKNSKPVSTVVDTEWGQCDVKDIRIYFQTLLKANPAYVETLYTKYHIVDDKFSNEFDKIFKLRDDLMKALEPQFIRAIYGMMCEKEKALCHPYPSIKDKIDKYGYDGKQAHHIFRLHLLMEDYFTYGIPLNKCLAPTMCNDLLMNYKINFYSLGKAKQDVAHYMRVSKNRKDDYFSYEKQIDYSIKDTFLALSQQIIKNKIKQEIKGEK